jgi:hypothetical protein
VAPRAHYPVRLLFHLGEITGNIWMVEWKSR